MMDNGGGDGDGHRFGMSFSVLTHKLADGDDWETVSHYSRVGNRSGISCNTGFTRGTRPVVNLSRHSKVRMLERGIDDYLIRHTMARGVKTLLPADPNSSKRHGGNYVWEFQKDGVVVIASAAAPRPSLCPSPTAASGGAGAGTIVQRPAGGPALLDDSDVEIVSFPSDVTVTPDGREVQRVSSSKKEDHEQLVITTYWRDFRSGWILEEAHEKAEVEFRALQDALYEALDDQERVGILRERLGSPPERIFTGVDLERTPPDRPLLHHCAEQGYKDCVKFLLEEGKWNPGVRASKQCTLLHYIAWTGQPQVLDVLETKVLHLLVDIPNAYGEIPEFLAWKQYCEAVASASGEEDADGGALVPAWERDEGQVINTMEARRGDVLGTVAADRFLEVAARCRALRRNENLPGEVLNKIEKSAVEEVFTDASFALLQEVDPHDGLCVVPSGIGAGDLEKHFDRLHGQWNCRALILMSQLCLKKEQTLQRVLTSVLPAMALSELQLERCGLRARHVDIVCDFMRRRCAHELPPLRFLGIGSNPVGDEGARTLGSCAAVLRVETLNLQGIGISNQGLRQFALNVYGNLAAVGESAGQIRQGHEAGQVPSDAARAGAACGGGDRDKLESLARLPKATLLKEMGRVWKLRKLALARNDLMNYNLTPAAPSGHEPLLEKPSSDVRNRSRRRSQPFTCGVSLTLRLLGMFEHVKEVALGHTRLQQKQLEHLFRLIPDWLPTLERIDVIGIGGLADAGTQEAMLWALDRAGCRLKLVGFNKFEFSDLWSRSQGAIRNKMGRQRALQHRYAPAKSGKLHKPTGTVAGTSFRQQFGYLRLPDFALRLETLLVARLDRHPNESDGFQVPKYRIFTPHGCAWIYDGDREIAELEPPAAPGAALELMLRFDSKRRALQVDRARQAQLLPGRRTGSQWLTDPSPCMEGICVAFYRRATRQILLLPRRTETMRKLATRLDVGVMPSEFDTDERFPGACTKKYGRFTVEQLLENLDPGELSDCEVARLACFDDPENFASVLGLRSLVTDVRRANCKRINQLPQIAELRKRMRAEEERRRSVNTRMGLRGRGAGRAVPWQLPEFCLTADFDSVFRDESWFYPPWDEATANRMQETYFGSAQLRLGLRLSPDRTAKSGGDLLDPGIESGAPEPGSAFMAVGSSFTSRGRSAGTGAQETMQGSPLNTKSNSNYSTPAPLQWRHKNVYHTSGEWFKRLVVVHVDEEWIDAATGLPTGFLLKPFLQRNPPRWVRVSLNEDEDEVDERNKDIVGSGLLNAQAALDSCSSFYDANGYPGLLRNSLRELLLESEETAERHGDHHDGTTRPAAAAAVQSSDEQMVGCRDRVCDCYLVPANLLEAWTATAVREANELAELVRKASTSAQPNPTPPATAAISRVLQQDASANAALEPEGAGRKVGGTGTHASCSFDYQKNVGDRRSLRSVTSSRRDEAKSVCNDGLGGAPGAGGASWSGSSWREAGKNKMLNEMNSNSVWTETVAILF